MTTSRLVGMPKDLATTCDVLLDTTKTFANVGNIQPIVDRVDTALYLNALSSFLGTLYSLKRRLPLKIILRNSSSCLSELLGRYLSG